MNNRSPYFFSLLDISQVLIRQKALILKGIILPLK